MLSVGSAFNILLFATTLSLSASEDVGCRIIRGLLLLDGWGTYADTPQLRTHETMHATTMKEYSLLEMRDGDTIVLIFLLGHSRRYKLRAGFYMTYTVPIDLEREP